MTIHAVLLVKVTKFERKRSDNGDYYISRLSISTRLINVDSANILWERSKTCASSHFEKNNVFSRILSQTMSTKTNKINALINEFISEFSRIQHLAHKPKFPLSPHRPSSRIVIPKSLFLDGTNKLYLYSNVRYAFCIDV